MAKTHRNQKKRGNRRRTVKRGGGGCLSGMCSGNGAVKVAPMETPEQVIDRVTKELYEIIQKEVKTVRQMKTVGLTKGIESKEYKSLEKQLQQQQAAFDAGQKVLEEISKSIGEEMSKKADETIEAFQEAIHTANSQENVNVNAVLKEVGARVPGNAGAGTGLPKQGGGSCFSRKNTRRSNRH